MIAEIHEVDRLLDTIEQGDYEEAVFDLDETLARVRIPWGPWNHHLTEVFPDDDLKREFQDAYAAEGYVPGAVLNKQLARLDDMQSFIDEATAYEQQHYAGYIPNERLAAAIPRLGEAGVQFSLWTNNTRPIAERILTQMGIRDHFRELVTRTDVRYTKPSPEGWSQIHDGKQELSKYLFVGDGENDRLVARAIGIDFFYIGHFHEGPGAR